MNTNYNIQKLLDTYYNLLNNEKEYRYNFVSNLIGYFYDEIRKKINSDMILDYELYNLLREASEKFINLLTNNKNNL